MKTIKKKAPVLWMLVKVPKITDGAGSDSTAKDLRGCIRFNFFGGENAAVRRLTETEIRALRFVADNKPARVYPVGEEVKP